MIPRKLSVLVLITILTLVAFGQGQAAPGAQALVKGSSGIPSEELSPGLGSPFPTVPPDLDKISVGSPDVAGYASVTGEPGAVPPNAAVAIINLNAHNMTATTADAQGGFSATLFAPPGSSLLVKYETQGTRIQNFYQLAVTKIADSTVENLNELPGTILYVGGPEPAAGETQDFHLVGANNAEDGTKKWVGWFMSGEMSVPAHPGDWRLAVVPGDTVNIYLQMRATSPAYACTEPFPNLFINLRLREMFGIEGDAKPWEVWFDTFLFTPTGLPIEHEGYVPSLDIGGPHSFTNLECLDEHVLGGELRASFTIPVDLPEAYYRPEFYFLPGITPGDQVPQVVVWMHDSGEARGFPILRVGDATPPRIPWVMFGDILVNGQRGVMAVQDQGRYAMVNRVTTPVNLAVIPPLEERSTAPVSYHLEPGSAWLSNTDRRLPPPPNIPLQLPSGEMEVEIHLPDGSTQVLGPAPLGQSSVRTPTTEGGAEIAEGTGHIGDLFHLYSQSDAFTFTFVQQGLHTIILHGQVLDVHGNAYSLENTYEVMVAHVLDLDPGILPTTPFTVNDFYSAGLHVFPPLPAQVTTTVTHLPYSDPAQAQVYQVPGQANRYGYFQPEPGTSLPMNTPGEFRVDIQAEFHSPEGQVWFGSMTWGGVVESPGSGLEAHGRRGMDYQSDTIDDMPIWFRNQDLPASKLGIENYYPYLSGDIHWGDEIPDLGFGGDSIHTILTFKDTTAEKIYYNLIRAYYPNAANGFRWPPTDTSSVGLEKRIAIGEAPLFLATGSGVHPEMYPDEIELWGYWYGSSQRPDVRVRELISEDNMGTAYWRFNDTYGYQIGEPADGDHAGDIKWEFGGVVLRHVDESDPLQTYAIYSSFWVLLPYGCDSFGCARVTPPFQDATGASINGGPIMQLKGQDIDMLFLPKCVRPGDILETGNTVAFCGHVGPPLDSLVDVTITAPDGGTHTRSVHANKIGWMYDPSFDFIAEQPGRWTVDVRVTHDRPYAGNGVTPTSHNTGTVLGTSGRYEFYVVEPEAPGLFISTPQDGFLTWPAGNVEAVPVRGSIPLGTAAVYYTIYDKGIVMEQGALAPGPIDTFNLVYDPVALNEDFPMLSLTAHEGRWEGLADEVTISLLAVGDMPPRAAKVTLIGEEVFVINDPNAQTQHQFIPRAGR